MAAGDSLSHALGILAPDVDSDGTIQDFLIRYANPAAVAFVGIPVEKLIDGRLLELAPILRQIGLFEVLASACVHHTPVEREIPLAMPGRADRRATVRARPVDGVMVVVIEDATEAGRRRRDTEDRLDRCRMIGAVTRDVLWQWDTTVDRLTLESVDATLFGHRPDAMTPALAWWCDCLHPDDLPAFRPVIASLTAGTADSWAGTYRFRGVDGHYRPVLDRRQVIRDVDRRSLRMIGSLSDLSAMESLSP